MNTSDISLYVQKKLGVSQKGDKSADLKNEIIAKASGIFLWVVLVVELLARAKRNGRTVGDMRRLLHKTPQRLDDLFRELLQIDNITDRTETLRLMQWVLFAIRPLRLSELFHALSFSAHQYTSKKEWESSDEYVTDLDQMRRLIRSQSRGLVEIKRNRYQDNMLHNTDISYGIVQVIHESVKDYLIHQNGLQLLTSASDHRIIGQTHNELKVTCLNYLRMEELKSIALTNMLEESTRSRDKKMRLLRKEYPFLKYAVDALFTHAANAEAGAVSQEQLSQELMTPRDVYKIWMRLIGNFRHWSVSP